MAALRRRGLEVVTDAFGADMAGATCGTVAAADFLGRVLLAEGVAPVDAGVPVTRTGNWIDGGRPAGYTQSRLSGLRQLAEYCRARDL